ncbi:tetratricopeptide repeat protein 14 isoform X2 [Polypterus senegalus]|uniref:tetratricopeptide repeat protein 14 isoform X2 n=1 Tax=Polypterus senegalus TaxID=55291 RepID=UPI001965B17F|nr:tetratricopeptide repeat protein 14 isoform X2 [Polypterus senegalus]
MQLSPCWVLNIQLRKEKKSGNGVVEQFIARKADLLFAPSWKLDGSLINEDEMAETYAVMPPLEQFMEVASCDRRDLFFRDLERGDVVIGRINSIREFGFFLTLICLKTGLIRDIEDLEITALCPLRDVPSLGTHEDPLSYYHIGDLIQAGVKDIDRYHAKLTVSLQSSSLPPDLSHLKLGVISVDDMPAHYRLSVDVSSSTTETYENVLQSTTGFANPSVVEFLLGKLGLSETEPPSLMRGLQSKNFLEDDYWKSIRKKQSASWALKCVKIGVDHFKSGRHVEAMNEYNKALEIDTCNVEALVARGALYATKGSLSKAIEDFELALENCSTHRNAKKYLCQTLVERGRQLEDEEKLVTAEGLYRKALALDETFQEAEEALRKLQKHIQKSLQLKEEEAAKEKEKHKTVKTSAAEKLRKLLKEEKRLKQKRKRSSSSTSSSSSSSADSSSSSHKKGKKRKRKHSDSSVRDKKHTCKADSLGGRSADGKEELYPLPTNTSASFMNREMTDEIKWQEKSVMQMDVIKGKSYSRSMSSSSVEIVEDGRGRSDDSIDSFHSSQVYAFTSKGKTRYSLDGKYPDYRYNPPNPLHDKRREKDKEEVSIISKHHSQDLSTNCDLSRNFDKSRSRKYSSSSVGSEYSHTSDRYGNKQRDSYSQDNNSSKSYTGKDNLEDKDYSNQGNKRNSVSGVKLHNEESMLPVARKKNSTSIPETSSKRSLPSNLLDIFSQIAQFEKEKCIKK